MKRFKLFMLAVVAAVAMVSCSSNSPETVAEKYLESIYTQDVDGVMECIDVTGENRESVRAIVADKGVSMIKDQSAKFGEYKGITVTNCIVEEDESKAQIDCEVNFSAVDPQPATIILVNTESGWKIPNPFAQ